MPDPNILSGVVGPTDELERILTEKVEAAREFVQRGEELLRTIRSGPRPGKLSCDPQRYAKFTPYHATVLVLSEQNRGMGEAELIEELLAGNVMTGSVPEKHKMRVGNIKRALQANVHNKNLKKVGEKYGLAEWPDEKF